ncbi:hypothetical protein COJ07_24630 [Bacillus cereus]|nr:hypothetical protein COJ07_24630 [Bacillus cereus]
MLTKGACLFYGIDMYNNTKNSYGNIYRYDCLNLFIERMIRV